MAGEPLERHLIAEVTYRDERIVCTCGVEVRASRDVLFRDRHLPLANAWAEHRIAVGARLVGRRQLPSTAG